jgi:hypothetical protein
MKNWCTLFPDRVGGKDIGEICCQAHDGLYTLGGSASQRKRADDLLFECIRKTSGRPLAWIMWCGVRIFGSRFWPAVAKPKQLQFAFRDRDDDGWSMTA